jgi:hypothetical protein
MVDFLGTLFFLLRAKASLYYSTSPILYSRVDINCRSKPVDTSELARDRNIFGHLSPLEIKSNRNRYLQALLSDRPVCEATTWHATSPASLYIYLRKIIFVRITGQPNADPTALPAQATGWRCLVDN